MINYIKQKIYDALEYVVWWWNGSHFISTRHYREMRRLKDERELRRLREEMYMQVVFETSSNSFVAYV